jgi:hypothetical protein
MTDTNAPSLEALRAMLANFKVSDVAKLLKEQEAAKPTLLSLTMDAYVKHDRAGSLLTDNVCKSVTETGREHGLLKTNEDATVTSVTTLMRYAKAYTDAVARADKTSESAIVDGDAEVASWSMPSDNVLPIVGTPYTGKPQRKAA